MKAARPYTDKRDLDRMRHLLIEGRRLGQGPYYVHVGDLDWWLFYSLRELDWAQIIHLWERENDGPLLGWSLFSPAYRAFDVFVHPTDCSEAMRAEMVEWAAARAEQAVSQAGGQDIQTMWVAKGDLQLSGILKRKGFERVEGGLDQLERGLGRLPRPEVPRGCHLRAVAGEQDARKRARASYEAFGSSRQFDAYLQNYIEFRHSPVYERDLDVVAVSPDGEIAAFCIAWLDAVNRTGLLEPVGTRPAYRRLGLGKATILEALGRLQALGMQKAIVCVEDGNLAAQRLYAALGFSTANELHTYGRAVKAAANRP
jgi:mycothiol synthase